MGKKQHQKDKLYLTCTEWTEFYGGKKKDNKDRSAFKRLPFYCCSLSFQPFEHPYCTAEEGVIFDLVNIVPFLKKYGVNPVSGKKMIAKDLVKLNFHKNITGKFHCPVTFRIFNENTHIVAVRSTGNVYSYEAVERLNIKANFWRDLLNDEPFTRKELITIQDPTSLEKFNLQSFYHLRKKLKVVDEEEEEAKKDSRYHLRHVNSEAASALNELDATYKAPEKKEEKVKRFADAVNAAHYSTGMVAAGFTSTVMPNATVQEAAIIDEDELRYKRIKQKGYVRMMTSCGQLNFELHCDMVPKTCENFIKLCETGYYNDTIFHRSIRNFMIQGGDPEGKGTGGQSIWGKPFPDEFKQNLVHAGRGVLSMANSGPDTNKSQFFITYRSATHLNRKHSVFGRVVGGLDTLAKMEKIEVDKKDRPKTEIKIIECTVFVNPYDAADEQLKAERASATEKDLERERAKVKAAEEKMKPKEPKVFKTGIGKYINSATQKRTFEDEEETSETAKKKSKATAPASLSNFSAW
ncbi:hypothetical protein CAPTEDRAFT_102535 [Capitella teleta]|uniref:RING-type E3 ubiquitin-protein ligase PPIL2 n=1 Tax=Capitella teleta TaxID=283909 RepID=R7TLG5_CAPTE|nr:hypothetical protein CAPTEDRAFT_102535 [Capitella teleta]|eukprot:ELT92391.1 hypothetical protein CAPTEDRAFT_102535 [Capitella teleta]